MNNKKLAIISLIILILLDSYVIADNILPAYIRGRDKETTYNFTFNFTSDSSCNTVLKSITKTIVTNINGIGYASLDISDLTIPPSYLCEYQDNVLVAVHSWNDIITKDIIVDDLTVRNNVIANTFKIKSGETYPLVLDVDNSEHTAERTLTFDVSNDDVTLSMHDDITLRYSTNQDTGATSNPTFNSPTVNSITFNMVHNVKTVIRGDYFLGLQAQDSGWQMGFELWNKDGDGTDNSNIDIWAVGIPTDISPYELFQIGYIASGTYYQIKSATLGGTVRPIKLFTGANTDQIELQADGDVIMATLPTFASGTALYIDANDRLGTLSSSLRCKKNIRELTGSERIYNLNPILFDVKDGMEKDVSGLIAEEVEITFPELVGYKREPIYDTRLNTLNQSELYIKDYYITDIPDGIKYSQLIVPLLKEVQKLEKRVSELEKLIVK